MQFSPILPSSAQAAMRLALFEPDIPQNCGAMLRLAACLGVAVDIIEPCGFPVDDRRMRRAGMDYLDRGRSDPPCLMGSLRGGQARAGSSC